MSHLLANAMRDAEYDALDATFVWLFWWEPELKSSALNRSANLTYEIVHYKSIFNFFVWKVR